MLRVVEAQQLGLRLEHQLANGAVVHAPLPPGVVPIQQLGEGTEVAWPRLLANGYAPDAVVFQGPYASIRWVGNEKGYLP